MKTTEDESVLYNPGDVPTKSDTRVILHLPAEKKNGCIHHGPFGDDAIVAIYVELWNSETRKRKELWDFGAEP